MFFTLEDPRAQIKGSRDPLGVQTLWSGFGRHVVSNLTTVTNSVRSFTVLLIGRHLAAMLAEREEIGDEEALEVFLRWEQVAGYARHIVHGVEGDIRGITRIRAHVREGRGKVPIGIDGGDQILTDQRVYGIWGLYTAAARTSGLLREGLLGVSEPARDFLEAHALRRIGRQIKLLVAVVREDGLLSTDRRNPCLRAVASALDPELTDVERDFYSEWLRDALGVRDPQRTDVARGRQALLSRLMREQLDLEGVVGQEAVLRLATSARDEDEGLAHALERILDLEALLAPAEALFEHALARPGQTMTAVAGEVRRQWGRAAPNLDAERFALLLPEIRERVGCEITAEVEASHQALRTGAYVDAIEHLIAWNALVMESRGGPPWAKVQKGRLDVRLSGYETTLPDAAGLPTYWRNSYFLDSLRRITHQIEERRA